MDHWSCRELCSTRLSMFANEIWIALLSCMTFYYVCCIVSDKNAISKWFSHCGIQSLIMMYVSDSILFLWNCSIRLLSIQAARMNRTACYFEQGSYFPCLMSSQLSVYPEDWGESCVTEKAHMVVLCVLMWVNSAFDFKITKASVDTLCLFELFCWYYPFANKVTLHQFLSLPLIYPQRNSKFHGMWFCPVGWCGLKLFVCEIHVPDLFHKISFLKTQALKYKNKKF